MPATEESLELKKGKEVSGNKSCSYEITKGGEENATGKYAREEGAWSLNPLFRRKAIILITCRRPHSTPIVHIICTRMRAKKKSTRCEKRMSAMLVCFRVKQWN